MECTSHQQNTQSEILKEILPRCALTSLTTTSILTFDDPETKGLERVAKGWIEEYLSGSVQLEEAGSVEVTMDEDDLYYEL